MRSVGTRLALLLLALVAATNAPTFAQDRVPWAHVYGSSPLRQHGEVIDVLAAPGTLWVLSAYQLPNGIELGEVRWYRLGNGGSPTCSAVVRFHGSQIPTSAGLSQARLYRCSGHDPEGAGRGIDIITPYAVRHVDFRSKNIVAVPDSTWGEVIRGTEIRLREGPAGTVLLAGGTPGGYSDLCIMAERAGSDSLHRIRIGERADQRSALDAARLDQGQVSTLERTAQGTELVTRRLPSGSPVARYELPVQLDVGYIVNENVVVGIRGRTLVRMQRRDEGWQVAWRKSLPTTLREDSVRWAVSWLEDSVVVGGRDINSATALGWVYAVSLSTGQDRWQCAVSVPAVGSRSPILVASADTKVVFVAAGSLVEPIPMRRGLGNRIFPHWGSCRAVAAAGEFFVTHEPGRVLLWRRGQTAPVREWQGVSCLDATADGTIVCLIRESSAELFSLTTGRSHRFRLASGDYVAASLCKRGDGYMLLATRAAPPLLVKGNEVVSKSVDGIDVYHVSRQGEVQRRSVWPLRLPAGYTCVDEIAGNPSWGWWVRAIGPTQWSTWFRYDPESGRLSRLPWLLAVAGRVTVTACGAFLATGGSGWLLHLQWWPADNLGRVLAEAPGPMYFIEAAPDPSGRYVFWAEYWAEYRQGKFSPAERAVVLDVSGPHPVARLTALPERGGRGSVLTRDGVLLRCADSGAIYEYRVRLPTAGAATARERHTATTEAGTRRVAWVVYPAPNGVTLLVRPREDPGGYALRLKEALKQRGVEHVHLIPVHAWYSAFRLDRLARHGCRPTEIHVLGPAVGGKQLVTLYRIDGGYIPGTLTRFARQSKGRLFLWGPGLVHDADDPGVKELAPGWRVLCMVGTPPVEPGRALDQMEQWWRELDSNPVNTAESQ